MVFCPKVHVTGSCGVSLNSAQGADSNDISHMWARLNRGGSVGSKIKGQETGSSVVSMSSAHQAKYNRTAPIDASPHM